MWERRRRLGERQVLTKNTGPVTQHLRPMESVLVVPGAKGVDSVDTSRGENTGKLIGAAALSTLY